MHRVFPPQPSPCSGPLPHTYPGAAFPVGTIKDRNGNGMDLTEAEDIKKRWQEYTEELYKKDLNDPDNHNVVINHLEPDILESKVKWALESITKNKANGDDGIPAELFQILKDDAVKMLHSSTHSSTRGLRPPEQLERPAGFPSSPGCLALDE